MPETIINGETLPPDIGIPDASDYRGRVPVTPTWQPGVAPQVNGWTAKGSDYRKQYTRNEWGAFDYGEICGAAAYSLGFWSWNDGAGESGSGSSVMAYQFDTTPGSEDVDMVETITGDNNLSNFPVVFHSLAPNGGQYSVVGTRPNGDEYEKKVGSLLLTGDITEETLSGDLGQWLIQSFDFREATNTAGFYVYQTGTRNGWNAEVGGGFARHTVDISADSDGYDGWLGSVGVTIAIETRKNKPVLYEEGLFEASGNGLYRHGYSGYRLSDLITSDKHKDQYGTYGYEGAARTTAWDDTPWIPSVDIITGALDLHPEFMGRNQIHSADGETYRVTCVACNIVFPNLEDIAETIVVTVSPGSPQIVEFDRDTVLAGNVGLAAIQKIEVQTDEGWEELATWPATVAMAGTYLSEGVRIFPAYQLRYGSLWGHESPTDPTKRYRKKRWEKVANLISAAN